MELALLSALSVLDPGLDLVLFLVLLSLFTFQVSLLCFVCAFPMGWSVERKTTHLYRLGLVVSNLHWSDGIWS